MYNTVAATIAVNAFKAEVLPLLQSYGISKTVKQYAFTGPFAYVPNDVDLVEFLEELFPEHKGS